MEKEQKKLRKLIKKNYSHPFRDFFNFLKNIGFMFIVVACMLLAFAMAFYIILRPMILAMILAFAMAFYIIKKLSETPTSKLAK